MPLTYVLLALFIACTVICYAVAHQRKAHVPFWVMMGFALGPLAVPFVFFAKPKAAPHLQ